MRTRSGWCGRSHPSRFSKKWLALWPTPGFARCRVVGNSACSGARSGNRAIIDNHHPTNRAQCALHLLDVRPVLGIDDSAGSRHAHGQAPRQFNPGDPIPTHCGVQRQLSGNQSRHADQDLTGRARTGRREFPAALHIAATQCADQRIGRKLDGLFVVTAAGGFRNVFGYRVRD